MVVRLLVIKLQAYRGVGAKARIPRRGRTLRLELCGAAVALLLVAATASCAQPTGSPAQELLLASTLERITMADGAPVSIPAGNVASHADQLIVSVRFTNTTERILDSIRITSPVPADLAYLPGSAIGPGSDVFFSVDNARSFGKPDELVVAIGDGTSRLAAPQDYTHVRWVLLAPLDAGASGTVRFRAVPR